MEVSLQQILAAREARAQRQKKLLEKYQKPLLCFTMNIPGPVKYDRDTAIGFFVGNRLLCDALAGQSLLYVKEYREATGAESYYVVDMPPEELKKLAVELEDIEPIGRLFDMDVLDPQGNKLSREHRRKCLICDQDAVICASRRAHGLEALRERTGFLLYMTARQYLAEFIGVQAYLALNQEVCTTPKPGLVDRSNRGAHKDMDIRHFFASANALRPYFCQCAETGYLTRGLDPVDCFEKLRPLGIEAEKTMFAATGGVNTHKGAIFSLGILCAAAGRLGPDLWQTDKILDLCAAMTKGLTKRDFKDMIPEDAKTAGEKLYVKYGISGVRGQAEAGFPAVRNAGLPCLDDALEKGFSLNDAGCIALLHLLAAADDTNLIHRSDRQTQLQIRSQISQLLMQDPFPSTAVIEQLDREFTQKNLSPGGSADLLALTYFLYFLRSVSPHGSNDSQSSTPLL